MNNVTKQISEKVYSAIKKNLAGKPRLSRLGASSIGSQCLRKLNYSWRNVKTIEFDGRILRLFETGKQQEERILADLRSAGFSVWDKDENGDQFTFTDPTGHAVAKVDGIIKGLPQVEDESHILEIKTHSKKSFDDLLKHGLLKSKPEHFYQLQAGMMFSGIENGFYVALCKDNEEYHFERMSVDPEIHADISHRIAELIETDYSPLGISENPRSAYGCKFCDYIDICVGEAKVEKNCRTCINSMPYPESGMWVCGLNGSELTVKEQLAACDEYVSKF